MPKFGQHETAQRLFLSGVGGLFTLQEQPGKVIKVVQPAEGIWSEEELRDEITGFLLSAKTQRKLAKSSPHWAPVYDTAPIRAGSEGSSGGGSAMPLATMAPGVAVDVSAASGAYAILDRYQRSVHALIDGKVNITNADLRHIISGILQGLIDGRAIMNRPHGNLKAGNVLLNASADLQTAVVHLADPAPDGSLGKGDAADRKDLADLGKIIYELVTLRPFQTVPIGRSREWDRLGPHGEDWRKLCNSLLDVNAPAEERDLKKLLPRMAAWTAKPKKSKRPMLIAAAVLVVLIAGGVTWRVLNPPVKWDQPRWEKLCLSYYSWFGDFAASVNDKSKTDFSVAPYPVEAVRLIRSRADDIDKFAPNNIVHAPIAANDLAAAPPDSAKSELGGAPKKTKDGDELIDAVARALSPEQWPLLKTLETAAADYDSRGWTKPAEAVRVLLQSSQPPMFNRGAGTAATATGPSGPGGTVQEITPIAEVAAKVSKVDIFSQIKKTVEASRSVTEANTHWAHIQALIKQLPMSEVAILGELPKFVEGMPRTAEDVEALKTSLQAIEPVVEQLVTDLTNRPGHEILFAKLAEDPAAATPAGGVNLEAFEKLRQAAPGYLKMTVDPRAARNWPQSIGELDKATIAIIRVSNDQDPHLKELEQKEAVLNARIATFTAGGEYLLPIEKNRPAITAAVAAADDDLKWLTDHGNEWVAPYITDPPTYIAEKAALLTTDPLAAATPAVRDQWQKAHTAVLEKVKANPEQVKNYRIKNAFDAKFAALHTLYAVFEAKIPAVVPGLSEGIAGPAGDWRHVIAARVATVYREKALLDLMTDASLKWADDLPLTADGSYVSFQDHRLQQWDALRAETLALLSDYGQMVDRLDHLQLNANEPPGAPPLREVFEKGTGRDKASRDALLADGEITRALKPLADRVTAILALDAVNDYPALLGKTASDSPEILLTAWRKLASAPLSEDLPFLTDEDKAETTLRAAIEKLAQSDTLSAPQKAALVAEIDAQRPQRWHQWIETLAAPAAIESAFDSMVAFHGSLSPQTDTPLLFNQQLYLLAKEFKANPAKEPELKAAADKFRVAVRAMPATVAQTPDIAQLLAAIDKPLSPTEVESSAAGAGPQLAQWEIEKPRPDVRIFYFPTKAAPKHMLEFSKLSVTEAGTQKTVFVCTTEMSVGLFADTLNTLKTFSDIDNSTKARGATHWFKVPAKPEDYIYDDQGPRAWKIADQKFAVNSKWLSMTVSEMGGLAYYPPGLEPPAPTSDDPMQLLSPWSAMFAARMLGCRLPTTEEWQAAYVKYEATSTAKDAWNLRGEAPANRPSWRTQQDYANKTGHSMKFPDEGIFIPETVLFSTPKGAAAVPWKADDLAKLAPGRITASAAPYQNSTLWFRKTGAQPGAIAGTGAMHDLVGNVAEYVFDGAAAIAVIKNNAPTTTEIDDMITKTPTGLGIIGGSSLSPPGIPFDKKQSLSPRFAQTATGFSDVGFRLAFTAPIDSIMDVLASAFEKPRYLPGPKAKRG